MKYPALLPLNCALEAAGYAGFLTRPQEDIGDEKIK